MTKTLAPQRLAAETRASGPRALRAEGAQPIPAQALHPILRLQRTVGNQDSLRLIRATGIQAKLDVSQPGDAWEQEADRVAERVSFEGAGPAGKGGCACDERSPCSDCGSGARQIHRKSVTAASGESASIAALPSLGPGRPLDPGVRRSM